jgi:hypothetical protein
MPTLTVVLLLAFAPTVAAYLMTPELNKCAMAPGVWQLTGKSRRILMTFHYPVNEFTT